MCIEERSKTYWLSDKTTNTKIQPTEFWWVVIYRYTRINKVHHLVMFNKSGLCKKWKLSYYKKYSIIQKCQITVLYTLNIIMYVKHTSVFNTYLIFRGPLLAVSINISFVISFVYFFLIPIYKINTTAAKDSLIDKFSTTVQIENTFLLLISFQKIKEQRNIIWLKTVWIL